MAAFTGSAGVPGVPKGTRYSTRYWEATTQDLKQINTAMKRNNPNRPVGNPKPIDPELLKQ